MSMANPDGKPTARLEHRSAGRVRVRVTKSERSLEQMEEIRDRLAEHPQVRTVDVNPATGSVLVTGDHTGHLRSALADVLTLVETVRQEGIQEAGVQATVDFVKQADQKLRTATNGRFSLRAVVPALFVTFGIRELLREGLTLGAVPWYVLIYYGVDSFLKLYPEYAPRRGDQVTIA
jgi:hypothetical protein